MFTITVRTTASADAGALQPGPWSSSAEQAALSSPISWPLMVIYAREGLTVTGAVCVLGLPFHRRYRNGECFMFAFAISIFIV